MFLKTNILFKFPYFKTKHLHIHVYTYTMKYYIHAHLQCTTHKESEDLLSTVINVIRSVISHTG